MYIAGYIVRAAFCKIKCEVCLTSMTTCNVTQYGDLINRKNNGGLTLPSSDVVVICQRTEKVLRQYTSNNKVLPPEKNCC